MNDAREFFNFLTALAAKEGAYVIEPTNEALHRDRYLVELLARLRLIPARIHSPDPARRFRFAERGQRGRWLMVWVPEEE